MNRQTSAVLGLLILVVLFFAVNILASTALRSQRLDLTENKLFTLSPGSKRIARELDEPIRLYLYFSESLAPGRPRLQQYGRRVREMLEEYERAAAGKIILEVRDPEPFSELEDEAVQAGLTRIPVGDGDSFYFGLVGANAVGDQEVIPFLDPGDEAFLEYEVSRLIYTLAHPERKVVGVLSRLPVDGSPPNQMTRQPGEQPWQIMREMRELFEVRVIEPGAETLPDDLDVLLVIHPKNLSDATRYAIDQYVLAGGNAVIFVDPHCEADIPPMARQNPMAAMNAPKDSNLPGLFEAWGVTLRPDVVAGDMANAQRVVVQAAQQREPVSYVAWLSLGEQTIDPDDPVTGRLTQLNLATAGILQPEEDAPTTCTPLLTTSDESMAIETSRISFFPDPKSLLTDFQATGEEYILAARVSGEVPSAFPDGPPSTEDETDADEDAPDDQAPVGNEYHLARSAGPINVVIVADVDMLTDRFWIQEQRFGNLMLGYRKLSDNGDFLVNALDNMTGSGDLISVRARGRYTRPFTLVEEIQREAEQEYLAEEQALQEKLRETEARLNELQRARPDQGELILTPEQKAEIENFRAQRIETRKQLRAVRHNLRRDIERLGTTLKVINIGAVPAAITILAVVLGLLRVARRKIDRRAVAQT
ncbi:MAG: Gldg family protein [Planctomycetota bacterium]|nr:Gldg family protein [Planctomycetota bacterium]